MLSCCHAEVVAVAAEPKSDLGPDSEPDSEPGSVGSKP